MAAEADDSSADRQAVPIEVNNNSATANDIGIDEASAAVDGAEDVRITIVRGAAAHVNGGGDDVSGEAAGSPVGSGRASPYQIATMITSATEIPLLDFISNVMRFIESFVSGRNTPLVQAFVEAKGLDMLFGILELQCLPAQFMQSSTATTVFRAFHCLCVAHPDAVISLLEKTNSALCSPEVAELISDESFIVAANTLPSLSVPRSIAILDRIIEVALCSWQEGTTGKFPAISSLLERLSRLDAYAMWQSTGLFMIGEQAKRTKCEYTRS